VDANAAGVFLGNPGPLRDWLLGESGNPRLVAAGALKEELAMLSHVRRLLAELNRAGRLRSADANRLRQKEERLRAEQRIESNDSHVLALTIVSGARTLATFDNALSRDFRNAEFINRPRGNIYRDPENHSHLLRHTPVSCGVRPPAKRRLGRRVK